MAGKITVKPNKNEFLLYSTLNALHLINSNPDSHFIRRKTQDHFKDYCGIQVRKNEMVHHSIYAGYVLTLNEAPDFSEKEGLVYDSRLQSEANLGKIIIPHIQHFYHNTDFEDFYQTMLPRYQEECESILGILEKDKIRNILEYAWEVNGQFNIEVIPMPLERTCSGIGPGIEDTSYPIVGPPFEHQITSLVAHEASHPLAYKILEPISEEIAKREYLLKKALRNPRYPRNYTFWPTCFEEHFIRAMQTSYINPLFCKDWDVERALRWEENEKGMIFIRQFYEELKRHKEKPKRTLTDVACSILERLDKRRFFGIFR